MKIVKEAWSWVASIAGAVLLSLLISIFVIQPYKVDGHSMDPTLRDQERIYVSKWGHTFRYLPDYGDIVIIDSRVKEKRTWADDLKENPLLSLALGGDQGHYIYVKRVIGKPGDVLEVKDQKVYRNGTALEEPYLNEKMLQQGTQKWVVPDNHVFVMGDNRNHSTDSRMIGYVPADHILGTKISGL